MATSTLTTASGDSPKTAAAATEGFLEGAIVDPIRLRTLQRVRWVATVGQSAAVIVVHFGLGFEFHLELAVISIAALVMANVAMGIGRTPNARLPDGSAALSFGYDILQLASLLYITGGIVNPFALLMMAPVTVAATILTRRSTVMVCGLAVICLTFLAFFHMPLPWTYVGFDLAPQYKIGSWAALIIATVFMAGFGWLVAEEARRMSQALAATQMALAREQQMSAVGSIAAAAAHELGSPLATIAVVSNELSREVPPDSHFAEDIALLRSEAERCGKILTEFAQHPTASVDPLKPRESVPAVVEEIAARYARAGVMIDIDSGDLDGGGPWTPAPSLPRTPEIKHGLANFIQNAVQFAAARVEITIKWDTRRVVIEIADDGPGFPPVVLEDLGEPYLSSRSGQDGHMGLGIFIAKTLLERSGATIACSNDGPAGGAKVDVSWPLEEIAAPAPSEEEQGGGKETEG
ncbi:MAG: ActS/PrrB/RegB family redox-sensitive histidine kinase [Alphaproteobacteria bacterium]|nr:ActS/PrrB/RegB family redox-sensitive histidine kinase [Alphaproteobacteria bacterium]